MICRTAEDVHISKEIIHSTEYHIKVRIANLQFFYPTIYHTFLSSIQSLPLDKLSKGAAPGDQFLVSSLFGDPSIVNQEDPVAVAYGTEPVRNDYAGAVQTVQRLRYLFLRLVVEGTSSLIQDQDIRLGRDGASQASSSVRCGAEIVILEKISPWKSWPC